MQFGFDRRQRLSLPLLAVFGIAIVAAAYGVVTRSIDGLVREDAQITSATWARYAAESLERLPEIAEGAPPNAEELETIRTLEQFASVFRFKIFDRSGRLMLVSDEIDPRGGMSPDLAQHNAKAAAVIATGVPYSDAKHGTSPDRPHFYAETYLPIEVDGRLAAIAEVYVDQTEKLALYEQSAVELATMIGVLMIVLFGVPAGGFVLRSRQRRKAHERLRFLARHDSMTGLINRSTFLEELGPALDAGNAADRAVAVHYIDIDKFKDTNDALGHDIGDRLIGEVARRLRTLAGPNDLVSRLGGDEFVVAQIDIAGAADATAFAERVVELMTEPFRLDGHELATTVSVGFAVSPDHGTTSADLVKRADLALYRAKAGGRNTYRSFEADMDIELAARRKLEGVIRSAAIDETFEIHFQPLHDAFTDRLIAFEALLRLPADRGQHISPAVFVPIAEDMGLIEKIGSWVIRTSCETAVEWPDHLKVSVNLSPHQFRSGELVNTVREALEQTGMAAHRLELEITEGLILQNSEAIKDQLEDLKKLGVSIVMDDFGTGYSSLSYLWQFPFDKLKIDQSFMSAVDHSDSQIENILNSIVSLGHSLNMSVLAEGVETEAQAELVKQLNCDQVQGFYYGRPLPATELASTVLNEVAQLRRSPQEASRSATDAA